MMHRVRGAQEAVVMLAKKTGHVCRSSRLAGNDVEQPVRMLRVEKVDAVPCKPKSGRYGVTHHVECVGMPMEVVSAPLHFAQAGGNVL